MSTSTRRKRPTYGGSIELSPLDVIALEATTEPFCPVAMNGGQYHPEQCLPSCTLCRDLLLHKETTP